MDKVLFIDLHNQIYRACVKFGATQDVDDSIIYTFNFFRNLRPLIEEMSPDKVYAVLEGRPQFRYDLYADYKANRKIIKQGSDNKETTTDKFHKAKDIILPLMQHLPITMARAEHYESDDVIGTLCENMKNEDLTVLTGDKDFIQLLQRGYANIRVFDPIKKMDMEAPDFSFIPWKCLNGDKSDNIKGLLGPKKALATVSDPEKFKAFLSIEENRANFAIRRKLIEFASVPMEEIHLTEGVANFPALKQEFIKMKFESITNDNSWKRFVETFKCIKY